MIIPAERKCLTDAAIQFAVAVAVGSAALSVHGIAHVLGEALVVIYCASIAAELYQVTDPAWRFRARVEHFTRTLERAFAGLGQAADSNREAIEELAAFYRREIDGNS